MENEIIQIPQINHHTSIPQGFVFIGEYPSFHEPSEKEYFFRYKESHLVIWSYSETKFGYLTYQKEFPLKVLPWVVVQLDRFEKPESVGGIPSDEVSNTIDMGGEIIGIACGSCIGGPNIHGYEIWNKARRNTNVSVPRLNPSQ